MLGKVPSVKFDLSSILDKSNKNEDNSNTGDIRYHYFTWCIPSSCRLYNYNDSNDNGGPHPLSSRWTPLLRSWYSTIEQLYPLTFTPCLYPLAFRQGGKGKGVITVCKTGLTLTRHPPPYGFRRAY
jgi:hypothetical protein